MMNDGSTHDAGVGRQRELLGRDDTHGDANSVHGTRSRKMAGRDQMEQGLREGLVPYPHHRLVHELFEEQVARRPDAVAITYEHQSLTYGELNGRANQLAHYLRDRGVGPDQLIGLYLERGPMMVI